MNAIYEQLINGGPNGAGPPSQIPIAASTYFSYIQPPQPNGYQNNQDFLNSSQTEKSWLNSSLNEKNWLNNSLSLPPEQRSQSLKEMVAKIVDDLEASGNANTLLSFKALASQHHMQQQSQHAQQSQPFQLPQPTNIQFYRQDSSKDSSLNNSFSGIFSQNSQFYPQPPPPAPQPHQIESQLNKKQHDFNQQMNSPRILFNNQPPSFNNGTIMNTYENANKNTAHENQIDQYQPPQTAAAYHSQFLPANQTNINNSSYQSNPIFRPQPYMMQPAYTNMSEAQYYPNSNTQQNPYQNNESDKTLKPNKNNLNQQQHVLMPQPPNQQNIINYFNLNHINTMPLAFPQSYSHHLATLSPDQQKYLLDQQKALFMKLEAAEMTHFYPPPAHQEFNKNTRADNQPALASLMSSTHSNSTPSSPLVMNSPNILKSQSSTSSKDSSVYSPVLGVNKNLTNQSAKNNVAELNGKISNLSINNQNKANFNYHQHQHHQQQMGGFVPKGYQKNENSYSNNFNEVYFNHQTPHFVFPLPFLPPNIPDELRHNLTLADFQKFQMQPPNEAMGNLLENLTDQDSLAQIAMNNEKLRLLSKQPYRQHRRTGPANELHVRLEECLYQFKCLEAERKKIENELYHINMTKKFNQSFNYNPQIPRLPPNPSRVDRLIVESSKEHAKVVNLVYRIENLKDTLFYSSIQQTVHKWLEGIHNVMAKRRDELMNSANRQRMGQPARINDDKDVSILASSINHLSILTSKTRTALWCALQISNVNYKQQIILNDKSVVNESLFNTLDKTNEFMKKTFEIKTDLLGNNSIDKQELDVSDKT